MHEDEDGKPNRQPELYDNQLMSAEALRNMWKSHRRDLQQLPIQMPEHLETYLKPHLADFEDRLVRVLSVPGRSKLSFMKWRELVEGDENLPEEDELDAEILSDFEHRKFVPTTLADLVLTGIAHRDLAGQVFMQLVDELKMVKSRRVLIAVDEYNSWNANSIYHYDEEHIHSQKLCVPHVLTPLLTTKKAANIAGDAAAASSSSSSSSSDARVWRMANGMAIVATSHKHPEGSRMAFQENAASIPLEIRVPAYSRTEFLAAVQYYAAQTRGIDDMHTQDVLGLRTFSASVPAQLREGMVEFLVPECIGRFDPGEYDPPSRTEAQRARNAELLQIVQNLK